MTPKEKAEQLVDSFDEYAESRISEDGRGFDKKFCSKQCALIAVDEILNEHMFNDSEYADRRYDYWDKVKQEIEKL